MYDHVKSINLVTATVHEVTVKNGLLILLLRYKSLSLSSNHKSLKVVDNNTTLVVCAYNMYSCADVRPDRESAWLEVA